MSTIGAFTQVSIDGFFAGPNGEIDWFKSIEKDDEYEAYSHEQAKSGNSTLLMGRTTYEMMKSYWPTDAARKADPEMAGVMNHSPKVVFSKTLQSVDEGPTWKNVRLLHDIRRDEILELKKQGDITILGSGSIVQQLSNLSLIDEYQLVVIPVVLGSGKPLFDNVRTMNLRLREARPCGNAVVVARYSPR